MTQSVADVKNSVEIGDTLSPFNSRSFEEGKRITWRDGFVAFYVILRYRLFD